MDFHKIHFKMPVQSNIALIFLLTFRILYHKEQSFDNDNP